jgi:hypothetical protein
VRLEVVEPIDQLFAAGAAMRRVGAGEIARHAIPVDNLGAGERLGLRLALAAGERLAIEVVELRRDLADDVRLAFGRQLRDAEPRTDVGVPIRLHWGPSPR